jgi:3-hydroxyisobutyrate dehydrogenase-like beta-hydroxyacid dehydrogenase
MQIGFIGVGLMGGPMVRRLIAGGHSVRVAAHRNRGPIEEAVARGAVESGDAPSLVRGADAVFLCVSDSPAVEASIARIMPHLAAGQLVVDGTTADPQSTRRIATALAEKGVALADAPMMGGPEQVLKGEAAALVGATPETFTRVQPLLLTYCSRVEHFGDVGSGHEAKLISNALVCGMIAFIAETYTLARKAGVDWAKLFEVQLNGSTNSGALRKMVQPALNGDFDGYSFSIANAVKDIDYFGRLSKGLGLPSSLAPVVHAYFQAAAERGLGARNVSRLIDPALDKGARS